MENLVVEEPDFFLLYRVFYAETECQDETKIVHLFQDHDYSLDNFFNWDGNIQTGGIKHEDSRQPLSFFIYEMELENDQFSGKGILHGKTALCPESENLFEIEISGNCDGSSFRLGGTSSGTYNVTSSDFDVMCLQR